MTEELKKLAIEASNLKNVLLQNKNIDVLLYLAKYNPDVTVDDIKQHFGKESLDGVDSLKKFHLVNEEKGNLTLTNEGIFQIDGLLSLAV